MTPLRGGLVAVLLASSGCAQIFGIDSTSAHSGSDAAGPAIDAPAGRIGLEFVRMSIGATATSTPMDLSSQTATFLLPSTSDPSGLAATPGTFGTDSWTADIPTGTPEVEFTLPDLPTPIPRIYDFGTRDQKGIYAVLEHPNPLPAPAGATIDVNVTLSPPYAGEAIYLFTIGSWTQAGFATPMAGATALTQSYAYTAANNISGQPLSAITTDDAVVMLRYSGTNLIGALTATPFNMIAGANPVTGTLAPIALDQTLSVTIDPTAPATRFANVVPAVGAATLQYSIAAAPGYKVGSMSGVPLITNTVLPANPGTTLTATYGNPFAARGWPSTMQYQAYATRAFTPTGGTAVTLYSQLYTVAAPTAGTTFNLPQGLPLATTIAGTKLATDGMAISLDPVAAVDVTFTTDVATNTFYQFQLFDLVTTAAVTTEVLKFGASGAAPSFTVPRALFEAGHTYMIRSICISGNFPMVAAGNLQIRDLPVSTGFSDSGVFTVSP